jgi:transketolase
LRTAFFSALLEEATANERVHLVTGDLGFGVVEPFAQQLPEQFLNAGVAEQNMTAIAAGLALSGKTVFTYSIANFPTIRCLEQIRNDVCYHNADVKVVAVGGGFSYGSLGMTHHATEDLALMRALPGMHVIAPGDPTEVDAATRLLISTPGPCYLRLGRAGERSVHTHAVDFVIGRAIMLRDGGDATLISTGGMLETTMAAAERLARHGIQTRVLSMHTIKPLDEDAVLLAAAETSAILSVEEHSVMGGLGSAVAEVLAENATGVKFRRLGVPSAFAKTAGSQEYLRRQFGLDENGIVAATRTLLSPRRVVLASVSQG